ncbi:MAG: hypothetical protein QXT88_02245 [Desulfurococcaceae archaeon]
MSKHRKEKIIVITYSSSSKCSSCIFNKLCSWIRKKIETSRN